MGFIKNRVVFSGFLYIFLSIPILVNAQSESTYLYVLGVAQDAGYPQAGCYKPHCLNGWQNAKSKVTPTSLAVVNPKANSTLLFEATPALPDQLYRLHQVANSHQFSLDGVFLTHAHIGHYTGLMFFGREAMGANDVPVFVMPKLKRFLENNGPWSQLVQLRNVKLNPLNDKVSVNLSGISVTPFLVPHRDEYSETVGYKIKGPNKSAIFIPDINKWEQWHTDLASEIKSVDYAFLDAAFYANGELPNRDMSSIPHPFVVETMDLLNDLDDTEKQKVWFIHINHTNPLLNLASPQSSYVKTQHFNIAYEGLKLVL